jgi:tetratricopeptide (TPR) repeat protein
MAKQRRPQSKPSRTQPASTPAAPIRPVQHEPARPSAPVGPQRRSTYFEAVAVYERGLEALQQRQYARAAQLLQSVLTQYPDEKELHERVRLYLNICERQASRQDAAPQTLEERLYAATLALNGGRYDDAIVQLRLVRDEDPDNDHALYMLAVAHAQRGEIVEALAHLERAIALNPDNRALARQDPDLDPLKDDDAFRSALETPPASGGGSGDASRRPSPIRTRTAR